MSEASVYRVSEGRVRAPPCVVREEIYFRLRQEVGNLAMFLFPPADPGGSYGAAGEYCRTRRLWRRRCAERRYAGRSGAHRRRDSAPPVPDPRR